MCILAVAGLLAAAVQAAGAVTEERAWAAASRDLTNTFYERAEAEFAEFVQTYTNSPRLPEAILYLAEARIELTNYAGALGLLSSNLSTAGAWADQYLFWQAEALSRKGDSASTTEAAEGFARVVKDYPQSSRRLEAAIKEAAMRSRLAEWPRVIELLQQSNGVFQSAIRTNADARWVPQGYFLLAEALLAQGEYRVAEASLQPLGKLLVRPDIGAQWQFLLCRIQLADGRPDDALQGTTNLIALSTNIPEPAVQAMYMAFRAEVFERLGQWTDAIQAYTNNMAGGIPELRQRQAILKITELFLAQGKDKQVEARQMLRRFLDQFPTVPAADLAWQTLGELYLRQHVTEPETNRIAAVPLTSTNAPAVTNYLTRARDAFSFLTTNFPGSLLRGKGLLYLGWCYWQEKNWAESQKSFQAAAGALTRPIDQAFAYFKLADTQFEQEDFAGAVRNYSAVLEKFESVEEVRTNLFEQALYQKVQAGLKAHDLAAATNAAAKLLAWYPDGFHTDRAVLRTGQEVSRHGDPAAAQKIFLELASAVPASALPEVQLAIAHTYEQQNKWPEAIHLYERWLGTFTNLNEIRARGEYYRALAEAAAGERTNALTHFTNFLAHFPTNDFAPLARWWVGDYYYGLGKSGFLEADYHFQLLANTGPRSRLTYEAQLMAGRAAVGHQGWQDARRYFTNLTGDANCPLDLKLEAMFALGDYWISRDSTDKTNDYREAISVFGAISDHTTNDLSLLAWGRKGDCQLLYAKYVRQPDQATNALIAYQQVLVAPAADASARSRAKVGLALALDYQAQAGAMSAGERTTLRTAALNHCLDVLNDELFLRAGETADPFWKSEAGLEAFKLAEAMEKWSQAVHIAEEMRKLWQRVPAWLEKRAAAAKANLEREESQKVRP